MSLRKSNYPTAKLLICHRTYGHLLKSDQDINAVSVRDARLFTILEKMQEQMKEHTRMLQLLVSRYGQLQEQAPNQLPEGISFPLKTEEDIDVFEDTVLNQQSASSVVSIFCLRDLTLKIGCL